MDICAPIMALSTAAMLAGLRPAQVRSLLDDRRIVLLARSQPARRYRPSILDAYRLRTLRVLMDAGLSEAAALHTLDRAIDPLLGGLAWSGIPGIPPGMLASRLMGRAVHVVPDGSSTPDVLSRPVHYPTPAGAPVVITLDLSAVLADLFTAIGAKTSTVPTDTQRSTGPGRAGQRGANPFTTAGVAPAIGVTL